MSRLYVSDEPPGTSLFEVVITIMMIIVFPIGLIYLVYKLIASIIRFFQEQKDRKYTKAIQSSEATNCTVDALSSIDQARGNGWLSDEDFEIIKRKRIKTLKKL